MSKELQSIQTLRSDFINHFSHEFKTPITAIKGFAELLREPDTTPEEREQYLQIILDESSHLADLANSTLLLTRLESQQFIAEKRPYPLDEQIKRCAILLSPSWEKKQISFTASLEPAEFVGNEELMRHVWINLLDNAVKYTPEGGEITVTLQVRPEELEISSLIRASACRRRSAPMSLINTTKAAAPAAAGEAWGWGCLLFTGSWSCAAARSGWIAWWIRAAPSPSASPVPQHYKILDAVLFFSKNKRPTQLNCVGLSLWWR